MIHTSEILVGKGTESEQKKNSIIFLFSWLLFIDGIHAIMRSKFYCIINDVKELRHCCA